MNRLPTPRLVNVIALVLLGAQPAVAQELASSDIQGRDYPTVQTLAHIDQELRLRTNGRLKVGNLGYSDQDSQSFTLAELRSGRLQMARMTLTPFNNRVPESLLPALPFLFGSTAHSRRVFDGPIGRVILDALQSEAVIGLALYDGGARSFYANKPIRRPEDLRDMAIRVQTSQYWSSFAAALGGRPVQLPFDRVRPAFRAKLIDAAENHVTLYRDASHFRDAPYLSLTEHTQAPTVLLFSRKVWDGLSDADRSIIRDVAQESVEYMRKLWDEREAAAISALKSDGVQIVTDVDKDAFRTTLEPFSRQYSSRPQWQAWIDQIRAADR